MWGRGRVLFWIRALRPNSIRADTSAESQTRAPSAGTNTGNCTATEQRKLGGLRNSGRIVRKPLEAVPEPVSGKAVNPGGVRIFLWFPSRKNSTNLRVDSSRKTKKIPRYATAG